MTAPSPTRRQAQSDEAAASGLGSAGWTALGTHAHVLVTTPERLPAARAAVEQVLAGVDLVASRFRADSELTRLNLAAGAWVEISPLLADLLRVALDAATWTDGLVDPTVGAALVNLGYDRTYQLVPPDGPALTVALQPVPGWQHVELEPHRVRVAPGTLLDLGATAKGLAADLAAEAAQQAAGCGVLVNLGGDLATAGAPPDGWPVLVTDDSDPDLAPDATPGQTVVVTSGGLATSGTAARRWRRGGSLVHHLVDPRSGLPAQSPWRTVSVAAATCVLANTASTAAVILGGQAPGWLSDRGFAARLTGTDGRVVTVGGWPAS